MMVFHTESMSAEGKHEEIVVLLIMRVRAPQGRMASTFWDSGSSSNFVREAFAQLCGFKGKKKTLSVTTLGGKVTDYLQVTQYSCTIIDDSGEAWTFKAYGLESITGRVSQLPVAKLRKLFPHTSEKVIESLKRGSGVDFLIGLLHPSWQPQRAEKAEGGGDLWIWRCRFGACVGGRHPRINEVTRKSDDIFIVNHTYLTETSVTHFSSHELEYCPARMSLSGTSVGKLSEKLNVKGGGAAYNQISDSLIADYDPLLTDVNQLGIDDLSHCLPVVAVAEADLSPFPVTVVTIYSKSPVATDAVSKQKNVDQSPVSTDAVSEHLTVGQLSVATDAVSEPVDQLSVATDAVSEHLSVDQLPVATDAKHLTVDQLPVTANADAEQFPFTPAAVFNPFSHDTVPVTNAFPKAVDAIADQFPNVVGTVQSPLKFDSGLHPGQVESGVQDVHVHYGEATGHVAEYFVEGYHPDTDKQNLNVHAATFSPGECLRSASEKIQISNVFSAAALTVPFSQDQFFQAEALGTVVEPKCGGCKCSKCPVPGSLYSFHEQKEYDKIMKNLVYNEKLKRWFTFLPWKVDRSTLPRNYKIAFKHLLSLERSLLKKPELGREFCVQVKDMVERGAAIKLSEKEVEQWKGDYHYLPMVGVKGKGRKSLRVCFDAARKQGGWPSMNECLCKGPDRFLNNLLSVILGFRNGRIGCVADIKKFHNQVHLFKEDVHMQRFLWRDLVVSNPPQTYAVAVNNFGVKPANCIATCALRNSADQFASVYPTESEEVKLQTYIDDGLTAAANKQEAALKTERWDEICAHASMHNKGWTMSGDDTPEVAIGIDEIDIEKVLGLAWDPKTDSFLFKPKLHVRRKGQQGGQEVLFLTTVTELIQLKKDILNRRELLSNVHSIFDPPGLLTPLLLQPKLLMRESFKGVDPVGWDDLLPEDQGGRWIDFLSEFLKIGELSFPRSLWPNEEVKGLPILIVFSDGSLLAFGAVAYIRWELKSGGFWTRLIMAKCKIAPKNMLSVPRMELNGAVLGNRIKNFILKDTNLKFSKTYQLVDSSTVLGYVHKECGILKPYEGIRVSEIQSTNSYKEGKLVGFAWVSGKNNPSDWCTKPRPVKDLALGGFWQIGPQFLLLPEKDWPIKLDYRTDRLEGEMIVGKQCHVAVVNVAHDDLIGRITNRISSWKKMCRVLGWILRLGVPSGPLLAGEVQRGKFLLLKHAQKEMLPELQLAESGKGRYRRLAPVLDEEGLWRVGSRVRHHVPFTFDNKLPILLPTSHIITLQIMRSAHRYNHVAQDGTLCRFRMEGYWTVRAGFLAKKVAFDCVDCRKSSHRKIFQPMGEIPEDQLKQPFAWGHCQMDLTGPFHCRGEVNLRTTKKI